MDKGVNTNPRISIILPVYNGEKTLKNAIASVLKQNFTNFELIIINDGSSDGSRGIIDSFKDKRILVIDQANAGLQKALNRGLNLAHGEYIARIDADDEWVDQDKLKKQLEFLDNNPDYILVGTGAIIVNAGSGRTVSVLPPTEDIDIRSKMLSANNFFHSSVMFRRKAAINAGGYSENISQRHIEDYALWLELGKVGKVKNLLRLSLQYSFNQDSVSTKNRREQLKKNIVLAEKYRGDYPAYFYATVKNYSKLIVYGYLGLFDLRNILFKFKNPQGLTKLESVPKAAAVADKDKLHLVIWESLPNISGGQMVLLNTLPKLKEEFRITVILPAPGELSAALSKMNIEFRFVQTGSYGLGKKSFADVAKYILIMPGSFFKGLGAVGDADITYVNSTRVLPVAWAVSSFKRIPLIWHNHNRITDKKTKVMVNRIGRSRTVSRIIAVSDAVKNDLPDLIEKTTTIYNGVNLSQFLFRPKNVSSKIRIGIIGDLIPTKGQDLAIKALTGSNLDYELNLIGSVRPGYEEYEKSLRDLVQANQQSKNIVFLGRRNDIPKLISDLDIMLLPSTVFEACPLSVLESLACGRPVIASNLGGTTEIIKEDYNGYLFTANDQADLAGKIKKFSKLSSAERIRQQKNCRQSAVDKYDLDKSAVKITSLIDEVLSTGR